MAKSITQKTTPASPGSKKSAARVPQLQNPDYIRLLRQATAMSIAQFTVMKGSGPKEAGEWVIPIIEEPMDGLDASELLQQVMNYELDRNTDSIGAEKQYIIQLRSALAGFMGLCLKESGVNPETNLPNLPTSKAALEWCMEAIKSALSAGLSPRLMDFFRDIKPLEAKLGY